MANLSPATQAVLDAVCDNTEPDCDTQHLIAAALRAVADQVCPGGDKELPPAFDNPAGHYVHGWMDCQLNTRRDILAIADELEGAN